MLFLYTAVDGDDVDTLAKRFSSSRESIVKINDLKDGAVCGKRLLICSDMATPLWMQNGLMCFEDLNSDQLSELMRYCSGREGVSEVDSYAIEFDEESLRDIVVNNEDAYEDNNKSGLQEIKKDSEFLAENRAACKENGDHNTVSRHDGKFYADEPCVMQGWQVHKLQENESIADVARKYGLTTSILQKCGVPLNPKVGAEINIPTIQGRKYFYTVKAGDDVEKVARRFGCSIDKLVNANMLEKTEALIPGTRLLILI